MGPVVMVSQQPSSKNEAAGADRLKVTVEQVFESVTGINV